MHKISEENCQFYWEGMYVMEVERSKVVYYVGDLCGFFLPWVQAYQMRNAGAVIHSHGLESCLATMMNPSATEFRVCLNSILFFRLL